MPTFFLALGGLVSMLVAAIYLPTHNMQKAIYIGF
jgi:type II secretory pathway component PulF